MDDRELLRRLHDWFLEAAPEHYAGCGLYFDVNESLAAAPEPLRVAGEEVERPDAAMIGRLDDWLAKLDEAATRQRKVADESMPLSDQACMYAKAAKQNEQLVSDLRSVLALIDARPPSSEEVEALCGLLEGYVSASDAWLAADVASDADLLAALTQAAAMIRRLALIEPSAGRLPPLHDVAVDWVEIDNLTYPPCTAEMIRASNTRLFNAVREYVASLTPTPDQPKQEVKDV